MPSVSSKLKPRKKAPLRLTEAPKKVKPAKVVKLKPTKLVRPPPQAPKELLTEQFVGYLYTQGFSTKKEATTNRGKVLSGVQTNAYHYGGEVWAVLTGGSQRDLEADLFGYLQEDHTDGEFLPRGEDKSYYVMEQLVPKDGKIIRQLHIIECVSERNDRATITCPTLASFTLPRVVREADMWFDEYEDD